MIVGKAITAGGESGVSFEEILPESYKQIEYLEATGTQYIDTEYAFADNFSWEITFEDVTASNTTIFGGRTSAARTALLYYGNASSNNGVAYICCPIAGMNGSATPFKLLTADPSEKNTVKMTAANNKGSVWLNGEKVYDNVSFSGSYISGVSQVVFADNYGTDGIKEQTSAKVYGLKMWQGESLVRDFVPCINDLGEAGLYDLVNARFYGNNGSGSFVAGKRIVSLKGNGIGCVLTVTTAAGALVKAKLGSKEVSETAGTDKTAILLLDKEGTWTITASLNGETKSTEILVEHNIEESLTLFPAEPSAYSLIGTYTASQTWEAPENGYFQIEVFGASGNGGNGTTSGSSSSRRYYSGGGGGGGGYSCSRIKMNKGDTVALAVGAVGSTSSATINSSLGSYSQLSVTSGANGTDGSDSGSTGGAGGVASGGNYLNKAGGAGAAGKNATSTTDGGAGGAAGYSGGNAGGAGGKGTTQQGSPDPKKGKAGSAGFIKIYRGNTNIA